MHTDTDNLHIHVAINKIHPQKLTIHNPYCDYKALGTICQRLELAHGLALTNHETLTRGAAQHGAGHGARRRGGEPARLDSGANAWRICARLTTGMDCMRHWAQRARVAGKRQWPGDLRPGGQGGQGEFGGARAVEGAVREALRPVRAELRLDRKLQAARAYRMRPMAPWPRVLCQAAATRTELYQRYQAEQQRCKHARAQAVRELRQQKQALIEEARRPSALETRTHQAARLRQADQARAVPSGGGALRSTCRQSVSSIGRGARQVCGMSRSLLVGLARAARRPWAIRPRLQPCARASSERSGRPTACSASIRSRALAEAGLCRARRSTA